jgi:hypothetical protein
MLTGCAIAGKVLLGLIVTSASPGMLVKTATSAPRPATVECAQAMDHADASLLRLASSAIRACWGGSAKIASSSAVARRPVLATGAAERTPRVLATKDLLDLIVTSARLAFTGHYAQARVLRLLTEGAMETAI